MKVVAVSPGHYSLHLDAAGSEAVPVPPDGRLTLAIPPIGRSCTVRFFGIKVRSSNNPTRYWTITVRETGQAVRRVSLTELAKLPTDADGFRLLRIAD